MCSYTQTTFRINELHILHHSVKELYQTQYLHNFSYINAIPQLHHTIAVRPSIIAVILSSMLIVDVLLPREATVEQFGQPDRRTIE